jgi:hypothetical protein
VEWCLVCVGSDVDGGSTETVPGKLHALQEDPFCSRVQRLLSGGEIIWQRASREDAFVWADVYRFSACGKVKDLDASYSI